MLTEQTMEKLRILAESAKYDVSCSSSGTHGGIDGRWRGHLPLVCRRRALHLAIEGDVDELLHVRLCLLHQPPLE